MSIGTIARAKLWGGIMDYKLRASRGTMTVIRAISAAHEVYEKATRLIEEGYHSIEVTTPDGHLLLQKIKKPGRR